MINVVLRIYVVLLGCATVLGVVSPAHIMPLVTTALEDYRNHKYIRVKGLLKVPLCALWSLNIVVC